MNDNKLIAEFMGVEKENGLYLFTTPMDDYKTDELYFHISWDWLMPVVWKIEDYLADNVGKVGYFDECLSSNDLEVRYQAVVEFIKIYNTTQWKKDWDNTMKTYTS
jgi:hypothetical protein